MNNNLYVLTNYMHFTGEICTSRNVPACSASATDCKPIGKDNEAIQAFVKEHPEVYAEECKESSEECLYTDVTYETCPQARTSECFSVCSITVIVA